MVLHTRDHESIFFGCVPALPEFGRKEEERLMATTELSFKKPNKVGTK